MLRQGVRDLDGVSEMYQLGRLQGIWDWMADSGGRCEGRWVANVCFMDSFTETWVLERVASKSRIVSAGCDIVVGLVDWKG